jgi:hypothetical protein
MTRRERLICTLRGEVVDRPAVNFYEIGGFTLVPDDPDPFNVYNDPSWSPLLRLAMEETDLIRHVAPLPSGKAADWNPVLPAAWREHFVSKTWTEGESRFTRTTLRVAGREMTSLTRRDAGANTVWTLEHLLKDADDAEAYLQLPDDPTTGAADPAHLLSAEREVGDRGIVMVDTMDPVCWVAALFDMEEWLLLAFRERKLVHRLLEKAAKHLHPVTERVAAAFPGRLWRIYGPEYASEPYLPPALFEEYVVRYTGPMVRAIQRPGGFARIHCHGRLRNILSRIAEMKPDGLDPIEPPPQGDISLDEIHRAIGRETVLFGNLEVSDLENLPPAQFEPLVRRALEQGTAPGGRGFVLMASASPYGRTITPTTLANYETMVRLAKSWKRG